MINLRFLLLLMSLLSFTSLKAQAQCQRCTPPQNFFLFCHSFKDYVEDLGVMVITVTTSQAWSNQGKLRQFSTDEKRTLAEMARRAQMYESAENSYELIVSKSIVEHYKDLEKIGFIHAPSFQAWCDINLNY